jgi:hypothetical protein
MTEEEVSVVCWCVLWYWFIYRCVFVCVVLYCTLCLVTTCCHNFISHLFNQCTSISNINLHDMLCLHRCVSKLLLILPSIFI